MGAVFISLSGAVLLNSFLLKRGRYFEVCDFFVSIFFLEFQLSFLFGFCLSRGERSRVNEQMLITIRIVN